MTCEASSPFQLKFDSDDISDALSGLYSRGAGAQSHVHTLNINPDTVEHDLARLVLTLIEFLRRLMELQAIRRIEKGSLSVQQEEDLGMTLLRAKCEVEKLAKQFGLKMEDLRLDLGPLGPLMK
ncbi:MAG: gas vesicle protein K [Pseudomonadota bacterium]